MTSSEFAHELTFNTNSGVAILNLSNRKDGGKFKVYVDGKFTVGIDTKASSEFSNSSLIYDNLEGEHKIIIKGGAIKVVGLVKN